MNTFGKNVRISLFGESHGPCIGITIDGLPAGLSLNLEKINEALLRRQGMPEISTPRREKDEFQIVSGYFENHTTGAPLTFQIPNQAFDSSPYEYGVIRPGHADYPLYKKYLGNHDYLGGGHASGRLTAPLVILGSICEELLNQKGIFIASRIKSIRHIQDKPLDYNQIDLDLLLNLKKSPFPVLDQRAQNLMLSAIKKASAVGDSVGGTVQTFVFGCPVGLGEPFFDSVESYLSHLMFAIPGVKAIEFGEGFAGTESLGSKQNDQMESHLGIVKFLSNHAGGINGGITNGNTIVFTVGVKPPSSIKKPQSTINVITDTNITKQITGKHDPCIVHRVLPVVEALTAFAIYDLWLETQHG